MDMENSTRPLKKSTALGAARRRSVAMDGIALVRTEPLQPNTVLPLVIRPTVDGVDLAAWIEHNRILLNHYLDTHGGVLFRGFRVGGVAGFERFSHAVSQDELLEYVYRSTPRTRVGSGNLYTSTEYPSDQAIPLHNENAYASRWPLKIWFFSHTCAATGGETPIADSRTIYQRLEPALRDRFAAKQLMYVRNYGDLDLPWQTVFQTEDSSIVRAYCDKAGIELEWKPGGKLRTRQILPAIADHPRSGEPVWFNQAHLFHISALEAEVRASLFSKVGEENLPRNVYYGDGSAIEPDALEAIRDLYAKTAIAFPWEPEDILLLDNMLAAHGRNPFTGERRVLVGMAEPFDCNTKQE